ncbi:ATP-binding protein [Streptomyces sp. NPDC091292]|uniref:ATP-binding protein n=1 Tax=Streptomyces sp. NPDC091292 TaxID=3365991 RepID=UPI003826672E
MGDRAISYDAVHIEVWEGTEAIRKRPGMYVGSTGIRGLHQLVFEVVGRAVNEVLAVGGGCVDVTLTRDGGVRVTDDGPGVPVAAAGDTHGVGLEASLTRMHSGAGAGFGAGTGTSRRDTVTMTAFGMGACVTNALSSRLTAEVRREQIRWVQEYARGVAVAPPTTAGPVTGAETGSDTGTTIAFWPDADIFETTRCSFAVLAKRFRDVALLNRGLSISLTDEQPLGGPRLVRFRFPGGPGDFVALLDAEAGAHVPPDVIVFEQEDTRMAGTVDVALSWSDSHEEHVRTFANSVPTPEGGVHAEGFRDGMAAAVNAHARQHRLLTAAEPDLTADRIGEGLTAVVSVKLDHPQYLGSTHGELGGAAVRDCVEQAVREHLGTWLARHPQEAAVVIGRMVRTTCREE